MNKLFRNRQNSGITLIALVITIIVLIILAGVAIGLTIKENGIFNRAKEAKEQYKNAEIYESELIEDTVNSIDNLATESTTQNAKLVRKVVKNLTYYPESTGTDWSSNSNTSGYGINTIDVKDVISEYEKLTKENFVIELNSISCRTKWDSF